MLIGIGSDHAGYSAKEYIKKILDESNIKYIDFGTNSEERVDYPDYGEKVALAVKNKKVDRGILVCGSGIGMSMVANRIPGIRGTLAYDKYSAEMSRKHNDSNVLIVGGRTTKPEVIKEMVDVWIKTEFEGGRHQVRLDKIKEMEKRYMK